MEDLLIKRGFLLRLLLENNNMQVKELAEKMCVSSQAVTNWLQGKNEINSDRILEICKIFNITADEFLNAQLNPNSNAFIANTRKISDLSIETLYQIADDYASGMDKKDILYKYNFDIGKEQLSKVFPIIKYKTACPYCNHNMYLRLGRKRKIISCIDCGHEDSSNCKCEGCKERRIRELNIKIDNNINQPIKVINYDELSLSLFIYLFI